jgi:hypothetical protein
MPLPPGAWKANVSGAETALNIGTPDAKGQFVGQLFGVNLTGLWDEPGQRILFTLSSGAVNPLGTPEVALFVGCLFRTPTNPAVGEDVVVRLAGTFQVNSIDPEPNLPQASARRNTFGWQAEITEIS